MFGVRAGLVVELELVGRWVEYRGRVGVGVVTGVWGVMLEIDGRLRGKQGIGNRVLGVGGK